MDNHKNDAIANQARKFALAEVQSCRYTACKYVLAETPTVFAWNWQTRFDEIREYLSGTYNTDFGNLISFSLRCFFYVSHYWAEYERQTQLASSNKTVQDGVSSPDVATWHPSTWYDICYASFDPDDEACYMWAETLNDALRDKAELEVLLFDTPFDTFPDVYDVLAAMAIVWFLDASAIYRRWPHRAMAILFEASSAIGYADQSDAKLMSGVTQNARRAANALHSRPGGSREKRLAIRKIWAEGNFLARDTCADQERDSLGMSFSTARRALRNTPDPLPWPAKDRSLAAAGKG